METPREAPQTFFIGGIPYRAWSEPDLSWLSGYGQVFQVWDQQSPGHLCFGVEGRYGRLLIKYAGARTAVGRIKPTDAIFSLQSAMKLYRFEHPALLRPLAHGPAGGGYAVVFPWLDAPLLRSVPPDPGVQSRVKHLSLERSLRMLDGVFDLHAMLATEGVIASDFHDGHVLVDFERDAAIVWEIDRYLQKPAVNNRGRLPGSSRFMAPEEYEMGAALDESTTVYNMGALAFTFFGDNEDRSARAWSGPEKLYAVASRATREDRARRYPSMRAFLSAWREAVGGCWLR